MNERTAAAPNAGLGRKVQDVVFTYGFYILFLFVLIYFGIKSPTFLKAANIKQIISSMSYILIGACGATIVVITGNMELSIGSIGIFAASVITLADDRGVNFWVLILIVVLVGGALGAVNGFLVTYLKMNSMLTTLGTQLVFRGLALIISTEGYYRFSKSFKNTVKGLTFSGLKPGVWISLIVVLILAVLLGRTKIGAHCYALGCNEQAAKAAGIQTRKTLMTAFIVCGMCAGLSGFCYCMNVGQFDYAIGNGAEFMAIAAAVIGGTSLLGGRGKVFPGTFIGVALLYVINNGLTAIGASPFLYNLIRGMIIFIAMYFDSLKHYKKKDS